MFLKDGANDTDPLLLQPEVTYEAVEALQPVNRLVYGLLRSPTFNQAASHHPDMPTHLRLLLSTLPPAELRRAVYPLMSSYTTPDELVGIMSATLFVVLFLDRKDVTLLFLT